MRRLLQNLFRSNSKPLTRRSFRPGLETLEDRQVLAVLVPQVGTMVEVAGEVGASKMRSPIPDPPKAGCETLISRDASPFGPAWAMRVCEDGSAEWLQRKGKGQWYQSGHVADGGFEPAGRGQRLTLATDASKFPTWFPKAELFSELINRGLKEGSPKVSQQL